MDSGRRATVTRLAIVRDDGTVRTGPSGTTTRLAHNALDPTTKEIRRTEKIGDEARYQPLIDLGRAADLLDSAVAHNDDPVGHRQRLV